MQSPKRAAWTIDKDMFEKYGKEGLERMRIHMEKLLRLSEENDIKLTVAVYPWPVQIFRGT